MSTTLTMVFKLAQAAERKWRKLNGYELLGDVVRGLWWQVPLNENGDPDFSQVRNSGWAKPKNGNYLIGDVNGQGGIIQDNDDGTYSWTLGSDNGWMEQW